jgi:hypothetical protein
MSMPQKLREAIDRWVSGKEKRNLSMLARLGKVSYSSVRRIMQSETDDPTSNTAMKLAAVVMSKAELVAFASEFFPNMVAVRTEIFMKSEDDLLEILEDTDYIPILLLSSHKDGTSEEEVRFFFGNEASYRFQVLVNAGHLTKVSADNWRLEKDLGSVNLETAREWISVMASICPSHNDNLKNSSIAHVGFESVNFETALAIYHAGMDFVRTTIRLTTDQNNRGDLLVMFGTLFNVLKGSEAYK